ncbi:scaffold protein Nfu/NifU N terminal-domain-containing protein [Schizothecium vesticola]|uniref:Scaffold protein Nfu/NifU N terminal-domain-containing protein n=1 Tax=Schizothecium vesticola TaxID=314040 RepID=A0AA40EKC9_9PEZI|nr:scaffold protein Nfu/NifU N terminal-domain-containing protein [Schizothecium vesticola]
MPSTKLLRGLAPLASKSARSASFRPATTCLRLPQPGAGAAPRQAHTAARSALSPTARPHLPRSPLSTPQARRTIFIQTESTPNADALKFLPNHRVLPESVATPFIEYMSPRSTIAPPYPSPLAAQLMAIDGVTSVFYGADFITVTKSADANWAHIRPEIFALITEAVTSGQPLVNVVERGAGAEEDGQSSADNDSLRYDESDSEVVGMIKELLETRIRPAIQEDGGDIEYCGFDDGYVKLKLRGACRTCDSSTVTLKNGIEGMLMHYIEEVQGVHQVLDPEEEIALQEFAKFEEKLKAQKGEAPPSTVGKGSLDTVPG